jgi:hypothetical protein
MVESRNSLNFSIIILWTEALSIPVFSLVRSNSALMKDKFMTASQERNSKERMISECHIL